MGPDKMGGFMQVHDCVLVIMLRASTYTNTGEKWRSSKKSELFSFFFVERSIPIARVVIVQSRRRFRLPTPGRGWISTQLHVSVKK
jgi:hypothetical protein